MESTWNSSLQQRNNGEFIDSSATLKQEISSNIQKISSNVRDVKRMVDQLGKSQDNEQLRSKLHSLEHDTKTLSTKTTELLKQLTDLPQSDDVEENRRLKLQREQFMKQFTDVLSEFQSIQRETAKKEKAGVIRAKYDANEMERGEQQQIGLSQQQTQLQQVDIQSLRERQEAITQLETDISDVNQIFKDLALMVHDQGEVIDSIEANVDNAQIHVQQGVSQIAKAAEYQRKYRQKRCFCLTVLIVLAIILTLIIYYSVKN